jgi:FtsP/CotA-like multicopper oxidase with cupredoxin domain
MKVAGLGGNVGTVFNLRARMNGVTQLAGTDVTLWYFDLNSSNSGFMGNRYMPSVHIEPIQGELIQVHFSNFSNMPHTVHMHGMDVNQANDGVPSTSFAVNPFESYTYEFVAPHAGTYHYHCHVDTVVHYHKGMEGGVIVRPPDGSIHRAWDGGPTFDEEVLWHLNTYDLAWEGVNWPTSNTARHQPNVFMINGRVSADAQVDPFSIVQFGVGQKAYLRLINASYQWAKVSLGGLPFQVVASDGRPMPNFITTDVWEIGPGERYDLLIQSQQPYAGLGRVDYLDDYTGNILGSATTSIAIA